MPLRWFRRQNLKIWIDCHKAISKSKCYCKRIHIRKNSIQEKKWSRISFFNWYFNRAWKLRAYLKKGCYKYWISCYVITKFWQNMQSWIILDFTKFQVTTVSTNKFDTKKDYREGKLSQSLISYHNHKFSFSFSMLTYKFISEFLSPDHYII